MGHLVERYAQRVGQAVLQGVNVAGTGYREPRLRRIGVQVVVNTDDQRAPGKRRAFRLNNLLNGRIVAAFLGPERRPLAGWAGPFSGLLGLRPWFVFVVVHLVNRRLLLLGRMRD